MQLASKISFDDTSIAFKAKTDSELKKANFLFSVVNNPIMSRISTSAVKLGLGLRLPIIGLIKSTVFEHFCGGESIRESKPTIDALGTFSIGTILDYSVEGEDSEAAFDATCAEIIQTIEFAKENEHIPFSVFKVTGLGSSSLLQKVQSGRKLSDRDKEAFQRIQARVESICRAAHNADVPVLIDAEETWIQDPIDAMAYAMMEQYNKEKPLIFNTFQMYRADMMDKLRRAFHFAAMNNYFLGAKLVRGAYMEKERERAKEKNYPSPINKTKADTDELYNQGLAFCIDNKQRIGVVSGSHNEYSNYYLALLMEKHGMKNGDNRVWFAQLYGMSDNISFNLAQAGYNVCKYVPYGPVKAVMPYLFRRASENTSVSGQSSRELSLIRNEIQRRRQNGAN